MESFKSKQNEKSKGIKFPFTFKNDKQTLENSNH